MLMAGVGFTGVAACDLFELGGDEEAQQGGHQHDHHDPADVLREGELPADQHPENQSELPDEVGGGELKRERRGGRRTLLKQRLGDRDRRVGAGGGGGPQAGRERDGARSAAR